MRWPPLHFKGKWVLVTGASSGLGREFVRKLALEHGANIVAIARRKQALDGLRAEIEGKARHPVRIETIVADLSVLSDVDRAAGLAFSGGRSLYAAILNAGVTHFGPHSDLDWAGFEKLLNTNVTGVVRLASVLVPRMDHGGLHGGLMIVSSMAGILPVPYQTAYSATKAFLLAFGCGLDGELRERGLSVTVFAPGGIQTEMTSTESFKPLRRWLIPVDRAARSGIYALQKRRLVYFPGFLNQLGALFSVLLPRRFLASRLSATYRRALMKAGKI